MFDPKKRQLTAQTVYPSDAGTFHPVSIQRRPHFIATLKLRPDAAVGTRMVVSAITDVCRYLFVYTILATRSRPWGSDS